MRSHVAQPRIAGVDPGSRGAVAILTPCGDLLALMDMPMLSPEKNSDVDALTLHKLLCDLGATHFAVEQPWFNRVWAKDTIFKLGRNVGSALSVCRVLGETLNPTPQRWKELVLPPGRHEKDDAVAFARVNYPKADLRRVGKSGLSHDRAEAICIAEYGRRIFFAAPDGV